MFKNRCLAFAALLLFACNSSFAQDEKKDKSPLDVVNARMAAHNDHDLKKFLSVYSPDVKIFDYPNELIGETGHKQLRRIFEPLFSDAAVHVTIHHQIVKGKYVVNEETVVRRGKPYEYLSIYEVEKGLIKSVRFIRG
jgi:hypothetical protein